MKSTNCPVVIITGASEGLGAALANVLVDQGFAVAICARRSERLLQTVTELDASGKVFAMPGDVTNANFRRQFIEQTVARFGRIDALVNNASTLGDTPLPLLSAVSAANLRNVFETNVIAPVMWLQETLPWLLQQPAALVLGISSDAAVAGYPNWGAYGCSKAALDLMGRTLGSELPETITSLTVDPGDMDTAMHHAAIPDDSGMASPVTVAEALQPLFAPLVQGLSVSYASGARLIVRDGSLHGGELA